ncbi:hypothetical protein ACHAXA_008831 [Cyclostephanos tholiformis]|uniref:Uncharacterized protein n=1 Tax=Cyclostephanos tholiformis TaxID=382380 RepID=A0ABD3RGS1_9STRA
MGTSLFSIDLQEAVTNIGVQHNIDNVKEQYLEKLNEDYFGYANQTIKTVLMHLRTKWCKVMKKERTDSTNAFYHTWVPSSMHVITFGHQWTKLKKKLGQQCHHLQQGQNTPLCWPDVQK